MFALVINENTLGLCNKWFCLHYSKSTWSCIFLIVLVHLECDRCHSINTMPFINGFFFKIYIVKFVRGSQRVLGLMNAKYYWKQNIQLYIYIYYAYRKFNAFLYCVWINDYRINCKGWNICQLFLIIRFALQFFLFCFFIQI